jgi:hypothetical protein
MFSSSNPIIMMVGIMSALLFISVAVWWVNRMFAGRTKDLLVRFVLMIFTALVALFIVDKTLAFRIDLLGPQLSSELFDLIKTLTLMIFSYYFGTRTAPDNTEQ